MKYQQRTFTVPVGESDAYRTNYDRIFGKVNKAEVDFGPNDVTPVPEGYEPSTVTNPGNNTTRWPNEKP